MLQTIVTSSHISMQGEFVRNLSDGRVMIRVDNREYVGRPANDRLRAG